MFPCTVIESPSCADPAMNPKEAARLKEAFERLPVEEQEKKRQELRDELYLALKQVMAGK
jgi:hypothetical protein